MKMRNIGVAAVMGLLLALPALAQTTCPPLGSPSAPMIEFDQDAFAYETNYVAGQFISNPGSQLTIVGIVSAFYAPLAMLNAGDPSKEYTFVISGLVSTGTQVTPAGPTTFYRTDYNGGTFTIYEGSPRNAPTAGAMPANPPNAAVPALFADGTPVLTGALCGFNTVISRTGTNPANGSFRSNYHFTNPNAPGPLPPGNLFGVVGGLDGLLSGLWCVTPGCTPTGYTAHPNGKWDSPPSTPTQSSTWGSLKQLYR